MSKKEKKRKRKRAKQIRRAIMMTCLVLLAALPWTCILVSIQWSEVRIGDIIVPEDQRLPEGDVLWEAPGSLIGGN